MDEQAEIASGSMENGVVHEARSQAHQDLMKCRGLLGFAALAGSRGLSYLQQEFLLKQPVLFLC